MLHGESCEQATRTLVYHNLCRHFVYETEVIIWLHSAWTGKIKITGILQLEHEKPVETFHPGKRDYLLSRSNFSGNFPVGHTEKTLSICPRTWIFGIFNWPNGKRPSSPYDMCCSLPYHPLRIFPPNVHRYNRQVTFFSFPHFCLFVVCRASHRLHNFTHFFSRRISKECTIKHWQKKTFPKTVTYPNNLPD